MMSPLVSNHRKMSNYRNQIFTILINARWAQCMRCWTWTVWRRITRPDIGTVTTTEDTPCSGKQSIPVRNRSTNHQPLVRDRLFVSSQRQKKDEKPAPIFSRFSGEKNRCPKPAYLWWCLNFESVRFCTNGRTGWQRLVLRWNLYHRYTSEVEVDSEKEFVSVGVDEPFVEAHCDGEVGHLAE